MPALPRRWPERLLVLLCLVSFTSEIQGRYKGDAGWLIGDCVTYRAIVKGPAPLPFVYKKNLPRRQASCASGLT